MVVDVAKGLKLTGIAGLLFWAATAAVGGDLIIVDLKPAASEAFENYIRGAARLEKTSGAFLWVDGSPQRMRKAAKGEVLAEPWSGTGETDVPDGLIHDWIGAVFIPGTTLDKALAMLQDYDHHRDIYRPEVVDSRLLERRGDEFKVFLRLLKSKIISVSLNTWHDVRYTRLSPARCRSASYSTRIAEVEKAGKPGEREMPPGHDHGFLWRLDSFWRFEERDGGVWVECEAVSLSRNVPAGLGWLVNPIVRTLPRESLANTLRQTRDALVPGNGPASRRGSR